MSSTTLVLDVCQARNDSGSLTPSFTGLVTYTLDRLLRQLQRTPLLICDELGYVSLSRGGVELLFRVFADRYERASILVTSNLPFSEWNPIFQGERMTAALVDRLTHHCHIFERNGESYRFRESMKAKKGRRSE
jgi:DNA replication protein DnaC